MEARKKKATVSTKQWGYMKYFFFLRSKTLVAPSAKIGASSSCLLVFLLVYFLLFKGQLRVQAVRPSRDGLAGILRHLELQSMLIYSVFLVSY